MQTRNRSVKTLDEHFEYVEHFSRISFYFARKHLKQHFPDKNLSVLTRDHTPVLFHGLNYSDYKTKWDNPKCQEILAKADSLAALEADAFEDEMWNFILDHARERAEENYPRAVGVASPPSWHCGSLTYDPPNPNLPEGWTVFHIANGSAPYSVFSDPEYLPLCFKLLMKESEIKYGSHTLYTATWLNSRPDWLLLFPDEWKENLVSTEENRIPGWSFGNWGQLVDSRGTINPKMEKFVRENGFLKYECMRSHCSFENMRIHLDKLTK